MADPISTAPLPWPGILRGSTSEHTHYISADEFASETEGGDIEGDAPKPVELIDLDGDEYPQAIDLTGDEKEQRYSSRNIEVDFSNHDSANTARTRFGVTVRPGEFVECLHEGREVFLRIVKITRNHGEFYLHGDLLQRTGDVDEKYPKAGGPFPLHSLMPRTKNELCALLQVSSSNLTSLGMALVTRNISDVGLVRKVIFTNKSHAQLNGQTLQHPEFFTKDEWKKKQEEGTLFCRRKYIEELDTKRKQIVSYQIRWNDQADCDPGCGIPEEQIFDSCRPVLDAIDSPKRKQEFIDISSDDESPGTSKREKKSLRRSTETIKLVDENGDEEIFTFQVTERPATHRQASKKYIYADLCAGAGGTCTGAKMAGLQLRYLLDFEKEACKTLELNFGCAAILKMDISRFSENDTSGVTGGDCVDVMHISFPCQGHSAANTGINPELDHERIATAYGTLESILKKCKPRILTLEQVPGILWKKDGQHFRAQVCALAQAGYSLRWKVVNFAQYGNSQARKRVIVIAASPGQILPPFPAPTHGEGLTPFVTVANVLASVPKLRPDDPMAYALARDPRRFAPWNANLPLRCCITGDGGMGNWHPSGKRNFSFQEKSQLQGFPAGHKYFASTKQSLGKQIGNAVPPVFAKALFEAVIPCLEKTDEKMRKWKAETQRQRDYAAANPIMID